MIRVKFVDNNGVSIEAEGHAGGVKGSDIVCASVSSLLQMVEIGINGVLNLKKKLKRETGF